MRTLITAAIASATLAIASAEGEFRHIVMFKFKPEATEAQIKEIEKAFAALPSKIDTITDYEWGTTENIEPLNDGFTHCFVVTFKDKKGLEVYLPHEDHTAFVGKLKPLLEKALVFDFTAKKD
jgi:quinol monooxygenase YgiN